MDSRHDTVGRDACGLAVEALIEPRPAADAVSSYRGVGERDWSRRWPSESIWRLRRESIVGSANAGFVKE